MANAEKVRKILERFPQGVDWGTLSKKARVKHTSLYETLHGLEEQGKAYNEKRLWFPEKPLLIQSPDYSMKLAHSQQLVPALKEIGELSLGKYTVSGHDEKYVDPETMKILVGCAKEHLVKYPDILELLKKRKATRRYKSGFEILNRLQKEIRRLILEIEAGQPIRGRCSICPSI